MDANMMTVNGKNVHRLSDHRENPEYHTRKKQVFIIGSKGIPAAYGGFETFVEKLTQYQVSDRIRYHVAVMGVEHFRYEYNGAKCFSIKAHDIGSARAILYDLDALKYCIDYCKKRPSIKNPVFYVLACRIGPFIEKYRKEIHSLGGTLLLNPDGHEWKRAKWSAPIRAYWKESEKRMVRNADIVICDSKNIRKYINKEYSRYAPQTRFIAYGTDTEPSELADDSPEYVDWLRDKGLAGKDYYLIVGRFVPENNYEVMIREFMKSSTKRKLAIITTADDRFLAKLERKLHFRKDDRIRFVGTVYDQKLLRKIRENAYAYLHGHEVGGTNPSLLEGLSSTPVSLLLNVGFNREVARDSALYWSKKEGDLAQLIDKADSLTQEEVEEYGRKAKARIESAYSWDRIVKAYEKLFLEL